jgi:hypothetical protein
MIRIYCDQFLLYDTRLNDLVITDASLQLEVNKTGSFTFTIYPDHPYFDRIERLKSILTVYKDQSILFRGRVLNESIGWQNQKTFSCEGELSFLLDSMVRPFEFTGSPKEFFTQLLESHNKQVEAEKQFKIGNITVTDPNDYINRSNINCESTWKNINDRLIANLGGYLFVRHEQDGNYLDYLSDFPWETTQEIIFGENLLGYTRKRNADEIATGIIPYGAKTKIETENGTEEGPRLDITGVNDGKDYLLDETAAKLYGTIFASETWDDVTDALNLKTKAQARLSELTQTAVSIDLSAADLSVMDHSFDDFKIGQYVFVSSKPHGLEREKFLISKMSVNLFRPAENTLTLGKTYSAFTDSQQKQNQSTSEAVKIVQEVYADYVTNDVVNNAVNQLYSKIDQSSQEILLEVGNTYVTSEGVTEQISTALKQTEDSFTFQFNELKEYVDSIEGGSETGFEEIKKYIRFEDGNILLGQEESELLLKIQHDRISFLQSGNEVAYINNNKLYITDGQFLHSLQLGNFAFLPRDNGNLSFKWIGVTA